MKTAAELAKAASHISNLAVLIQPEQHSSPYANQRKLIQWHLRTAARLTLEIAEATATKEKQ